jgi:hypothetical protein
MWYGINKVSSRPIPFPWKNFKISWSQESFEFLYVDGALAVGYKTYYKTRGGGFFLHLGHGVSYEFDSHVIHLCIILVSNCNNCLFLVWAS